jgi:hypothetical protein
MIMAMTVLDRLERRIGFIAVPSLMRIVVMFTALVCVLAYTDRQFLSVLDLNPELIKRGQVWRLFTYVFIPKSPLTPGSLLSPLWAVVALWFLWFIGEGLERAWGAFRVTLYFLVGMIGTTVAAFLFSAQFSNSMLATSLFFAFAWFYPDEVIYVFFILPVKIKWLAWIFAAFLILGFIGATNTERVALLIAFSNFFIFFGPPLFHQVRHRKDVASRRKRFEVQTRATTEEPLHRCAVCGATEASDPNLEFRVSRDGEEYCVPHLPSAAPVTSR